MKHWTFIFLVFFGGTMTFQYCKVPTNNQSGKSELSEDKDVNKITAKTSTSSIKHASIDTIIWNEHIHDFQTVPSGPPATTKYTFVNRTNKTIKIDRVEVGCSCTASDYSKNDIQPNDTGWISAAYKTANTFGYFRKHVDVFFNNGKSTHLILTGTVDPMITSPK